MKAELLSRVFIILCLISLSSCEEETFDTNIATDNITIKMADLGLFTKSDMQAAEELARTVVVDEDSLLLQEFVSDNLSQPLIEDCPDTKGTVITNANITDALGEFGMEIFIDNYDEIAPAETFNQPAMVGDDQYVAAGKVSYSSSDNNWILTNGSGSQYQWLWKMKHTFWSYAPTSHSGTFSYSSLGGRSSMSITGYTCPGSASDQQDLLVAYNNRIYDDTNKSEYISIAFRHALADIYFDVSSITDFTVTKIEIIGAYSKGDCAVTGGDLDDTDVTKAFSWSSLSTTATFSMTSGFGTGETPDHFLMIPQTLPSDAKLKITVQKNGVTTTKEVDFSATWKSGKYYKYKLTYDDAEYNFTLASGYSSTQSFTGKKTSGSEVKYVKLKTQRKKTTDTSFKSWDYWDIQSYQIGSGSVVPVAATATSITAEDLIVTEDLANQQLKIESTRWIGKDKGGHKYWTNEDGFSGDDSGTGWSPKSWGSDGENKGVIDLSKFNYKTETETSMNTANCYIVRHAGTYKIPLVYGNGVQGGSATDAGYKFTTSGSTTNFLKTFKNHLNVDITSSFIENNSNCKAKDAVIKWQDRQEAGKNPVISSVELVGNTATTYNKDNVRYIQFTVSQSDIRQTNAVIAVRDNSNNIMWSWHIWVTNDPAVKDGSITVKNQTGDYYSFFPSYALGWIEPVTYDDREDVKITLVQKTSGKTVTVTVKQTTPDKEPATGVMYQWGRKDPFPSVDALSGFNTTPITSGKTLGAVIQDPSTFYMRTSNWCSSTYRNLWSGILNNTDYTVISKSNSATKKTIYDPSPVGYKVPSIYAFTNFSKTGTGFDNTPSNFNVPSGTSFDMGWNFNTGTGTGGTIFFYAAGWRENNPSPTWDGSPGAGKLKLGLDGNYQSAIHYGKASSTDSSQNMAYWSFNNKDMQMFNNQYQTLGCPVRPVEE